MVYIDKDGKIYEGDKPWGLSRLMDLLWAPLNFAVCFVQTLINPALNRIEGRPYTVGGSDLGRSSSAPRRPPNRFHMSRFRTMSQIAPPPPPSCRSCMM
ncbi:uncharacterized protein LOC142328983 [Lycorma delicatula]|uniref:uncharacterized protein LOC142328983 n=1 Tax=Lycorma delicatula TaxID=130591 RepID=UPI003F5173B6